MLLKSAAVLGFAWVLSSGLGVTSTKPPEPEAAARPESLPHDGVLTAERGKPTVVVVLDPDESSAELGLAELRRTIAGRDATLVAHVVFVVRGEEFVPRGLWTNATSIPGVHVLRDSGGAAAARIGATPGTTVLYGSNRRLLFRGRSPLDLPPLLDRATTDSAPPPAPPRRDAAERRPGPLDDWVDPDGTRDALL